MTEPRPPATEVQTAVNEALAAGDVSKAVDHCLRAIGPDIERMLQVLARDHGLASEAYSVFCEKLWRGIAGFQGRSSLRTWSIAVARQALSDTARSARRARLEPWQAELGEVLVDEVRSPTPPHLQTSVKDAMAELRAQLPVEDLTLLTLRLDQRMSWRELAVALGEDPDEPVALTRRSASLRKRFERIKRDLADKAREAGLLTDES